MAKLKSGTRVYGSLTVDSNLTSNQLNVSGVSTFAGIATHTASLFGTTASFTGAVTASNIIKTVGITVDNGSTAITTGTKGYIEVPYSGTIQEWKIISSVSGSVVFDVWKTNAAIPTNANSITAAAKPTLTTAQRATSTALTGWTTTVSANDVFGFEVESASTTTKATLILVIKQT